MRRIILHLVVGDFIIPVIKSGGSVALFVVLGCLAVILGIASLITPIVGSTAAEYIGCVAFLVMAWAACAFWRRGIARRTVIDAIAHRAHGQQRPSTDLRQAVSLAHGYLLQQGVDLRDVHNHAAALLSGPMPYSTHDLAAATALAFLKHAHYKASLSTCQTTARSRVANWKTAGMINAMLADAFEETVRSCYECEDVAKPSQTGEPRSRPATVEQHPATAKRVRTYADEVATRLVLEFGVEDGERLATEQQVRRIIDVYRADVVPPP